MIGTAVRSPPATGGGVKGKAVTRDEEDVTEEVMIRLHSLDGEEVREGEGREGRGGADDEVEGDGGDGGETRALTVGAMQFFCCAVKRGESKDQGGTSVARESEERALDAPTGELSPLAASEGILLLQQHLLHQPRTRSEKKFDPNESS